MKMSHDTELSMMSGGILLQMVNQMVHKASRQELANENCWYLVESSVLRRPFLFTSIYTTSYAINHSLSVSATPLAHLKHWMSLSTFCNAPFMQLRLSYHYTCLTTSFAFYITEFAFTLLLHIEWIYSTNFQATVIAKLLYASPVLFANPGNKVRLEAFLHRYTKSKTIKCAK